MKPLYRIVPTTYGQFDLETLTENGFYVSAGIFRETAQEVVDYIRVYMRPVVYLNEELVEVNSKGEVVCNQNH